MKNRLADYSTSACMRTGVRCFHHPCFAGCYLQSKSSRSNIFAWAIYSPALAIVATLLVCTLMVLRTENAVASASVKHLDEAMVSPDSRMMFATYYIPFLWGFDSQVATQESTIRELNDQISTIRKEVSSEHADANTYLYLVLIIFCSTFNV